MEYFLHVKPTFDCLLKCHDCQTFMQSGFTYSFLASEKVNLLFYPADNTQPSLPFCYNFNASSPTHSANVSITNFKNNNFLLNVSPFYFGSSKSMLLSSKKINLNNKSHTIYYNTNANLNLKIECESDTLQFDFDEKISSINTKTLNNNILIYAQSSTKGIVVLLEFFEDKYKTIVCDVVDILEENKTCIKTYKSLFDFANHGVINTYDFQSKLQPQTQLVYANSSPFLAKHKQIIPFAFFEAVKLKNYKLARFYLDSTLSKKLTDKHFDIFFGSFDNISQSLHQNAQNEIALIYTDKKCNSATIFELDFNQNNKILNITQKEN